MKNFRFSPILLRVFFAMMFSFSKETIAVPAVEDVAVISDIWAKGRYLAPDIACEPTSWDSAFVEAATRLSTGTVTLADAHRALLNASPAYYMPEFQQPYSSAAVQGRKTANRLTTDKDVYVLRISGALTKEEISTLGSRSRRATLVLDVRSAPGEGILDIVTRSAAFEDVKSLGVLRLPTVLPSIQSINYRGYPSELGFSSGYFRSSLVDSVTDQETAIAESSKTPDAAIVVLGNRFTLLPRALMAARLSGQARFISVDGGFAYEGVPTVDITANDRHATMVLGRFKGFSLAKALSPDAVIAEKCANDTKCLGNIARSQSLNRIWNVKDNLVCRALPAPDAFFGDSGNYPSLGARLYAAAKLYHVLRLFHPLPKVLGDRLRERYFATLEAVAIAPDERAYALAIGRFLAPMSDGHVEIASMSYFEAFGLGDLPVQTLLQEEKIYIGCDHPDAPGLKTGDQVLSIDGHSIPSLLREIKLDVTATPTEENFSKAARFIFRGSIGSALTVEVRGLDGSDREVRLTRSQRSSNRCTLPWSPRRDVEIMWVRPDLVYLNLSAVGPDRIEEIIPELTRAKYIIVDDRGAAQGGAWPLAAHVARGPNLRVARFVTPIISGREIGSIEYFDATATVTRVQAIRSGIEPAISAKLIILVDANTASQAEHSVLILKAAGGAVTVGSLTKGASGDVTGMVLPGNIAVRFSGQAVTNLEGHQVLGVGLTPDYIVKPTLKDAIQNVDPVIKAAIELVEKKGVPFSPPSHH